MTAGRSPLTALFAAYQSGTTDPVAQTHLSLSRANGNASHNTYIQLDPEWALAEAHRQSERAVSSDGTMALFGLPVSLKDCFDLAGFPTSSGSKFYAAHKQNASSDSWVAARLRGAGAVIIGKTHLHQLAYGITGENQDYGDCLQPANPTRLTGGSSSGAAASVQENSVMAAIGTDTGGSIRVPAALCGLAGYRASHGVGEWAGGFHLAPSFDTLGWLFRDLRDAPLLAEVLFDLPPEPPASSTTSIGVLSGAQMEECDPAVRRSMEVWQDRLRRIDSVRLESIDPEFWSEAWDIYAPLQASEAAQLHRGYYREFEPAIAARLDWGASLGDDEIRQLRLRHQEFRRAQAALFRRFDMLLAPATPISYLTAGADLSEARPRILRFTSPASLAGTPAVVLPSQDCGLQLMAGHGNDRRLLRFAAFLGEQPMREQN